MGSGLGALECNPLCWQRPERGGRGFDARAATVNPVPEVDPGIKLSASGTRGLARGFGVTLGDDAGCLPMIILGCTGRRRCDLRVYSGHWELAKWSRSVRRGRNPSHTQ